MHTPIIENKNFQVIPREDPRLHVEDIEYPGETGNVFAYFARRARMLTMYKVLRQSF